jgi:hypothetical protein
MSLRAVWVKYQNPILKKKKKTKTKVRANKGNGKVKITKDEKHQQSFVTHRG